MTQNQKKLNIRFGKGGQYTALFSNIGHEDPNAFYLLSVYISKSMNPTEDVELLVKDCQRLLKTENDNYYYNELD